MHRPFYLDKKWPLITTALCLLLAVIFNSRSFFIGYAMAFIIVFTAMRRLTFSQSWKLLLLPLSLLLIAVIAFGLRPDSSRGRMLVYKIAGRILKDHWLTGIGWNKFGLVYGQYQADHFRSGNYTNKELLLADNTKHAFNDYLQFIIETGAGGCIILLLISAAIVYCIKKAVSRNHPAPALLLIAGTQLTAVSIAAFFTHVFEKPGSQCLFISSFLCIIYYAKKETIPIKAAITVLLLMNGCCLSYHFGNPIFNRKIDQAYSQATDLYQAGFINESLRHYQALLPLFENDPAFLTDLSIALIAHGDYLAAIPLLQKITTISTTSYTWLQLAQCYDKTGQLKEAEQAYLMAVYIVPNRFHTRFMLFNFYEQTNQTAKAILTGKAILSLPVKIPSLRVDHIKEAVTARLKIPF